MTTATGYNLVQELGRPHIRVELLSDPTYLSGARELVSSVSRRLGFNEEGCGQIALAVDEALCNIIRHGYDRRKDGVIWISIWPLSSGALDASAAARQALAGPGIAIVLEDEARQVDPSVIKSRDLDEIRPGGLGVHIIKQVMDEAIYQKRESVGMRLTLLKRVPAGKDSSSKAVAASSPRASATGTSETNAKGGN
jgi:anti-sigma regulatory factor (Ser/Thr protein kinase)